MRLLFTLLAVSSLILTSCGDKKEVSYFVLENPLDTARTEVVIFSKEEVMELFPDIRRYDIPALVDEKGAIFPYQLDDLDNDKEWDEMAVAIDFKKLEHKRVRFIAFAKALLPIFPVSTDIHFGKGNVKPYAREVQKYTRTEDPRKNDTIFLQLGGPTWENEKVGFRMNFDPRNTIDVFGKTSSKMLLKEQGLTTSAEKKSDWGMKITDSKKSLGAGSLAINYQDSLYRLQGVYGARFEVIADGPVRSIFTVTYLDEPIGDVRINAVHQINIEKGDWFYKSDVTLHGKTQGMELVTGIIDSKANEIKSEQISNGGTIIYTYGTQSENDDLLGMAVISPPDNLSLSKTSDNQSGIDETHLIRFTNKTSQAFYFMSGWEASDPRFQTEEGFKAAVKEAQTFITQPIILNKSKSIDSSQDGN
jgi:hypothetical protein